jgi:hypothetical protein
VPDFARETAAGGNVAGVDEVGRGAWAGPVFAAAAILSPEAAATPELAGLDDSKAISKTIREQFFNALTRASDRGEAWLALGRADVAEIDALNILGATMLAMQRAVAALPVPPDSILVDGNRLPDLPAPAPKPSSAATGWCSPSPPPRSTPKSVATAIWASSRKPLPAMVGSAMPAMAHANIKQRWRRSAQRPITAKASHRSKNFSNRPLHIVKALIPNTISAIDSIF